MAQKDNALSTSQLTGSVAAAVIDDDEPYEPVSSQAADHLHDGPLLVIGRNDNGHTSICHKTAFLSYL
jgi:hypothetical protein